MGFIFALFLTGGIVFLAGFYIIAANSIVDMATGNTEPSLYADGKLNSRLRDENGEIIPRLKLAPSRPTVVEYDERGRLVRSRSYADVAAEIEEASRKPEFRPITPDEVVLPEDYQYREYVTKEEIALVHNELRLTSVDSARHIAENRHLSNYYSRHPKTESTAFLSADES